MEVKELLLENDFLSVRIVPEIGGRITSVYNKKLGHEFLWHNANLSLNKLTAGANYDTNFWGGIDELIPNDIPETVDGINYPDHGELWTTSLDGTSENGKIILTGVLSLSGLYYKKTIRLNPLHPVIEIEYYIENTSGFDRNFLWKLHAAVVISKGCRLETKAQKAKVVNPKTSRFLIEEEFTWPVIHSIDVSVVPDKNGTMDFFYLYDNPEGKMSMISGGGKYCFSYSYDKRIFPYQWYFASYGQFNNHYVAVLEPATAMPVSVNEATALGQCSFLKPGEGIHTFVHIYAGENL